TTPYRHTADQRGYRAAIMDHGRILALDSPAELKRSIGAERVVKVVADGDQDALARRLAGLEGATHSSVADGYVVVQVHGAGAELPRVIEWAELGGFHVTDLSVTEPSLETVFIRLTGKDLRE